jgi:hypothetical protein
LLKFIKRNHAFAAPKLFSLNRFNKNKPMIVGHDSEVVPRGYAHLDADDTKAATGKLPDVTAR